MHGSGGEEWKHRRHMWPVPATATTVAPAADSSSSEFICKDGRKIRVGDCALFNPPPDSPPFIGIIRKLTLKEEESPSLEVNWLYRPADLKLAKGISLEAAPNEVFYSFHKNETPAASLLHPCKVAFLRKGVELPSVISAFVCRRVYDIDKKRVWWLTDKDYINTRQEMHLDKTRQEMHGAVQSGGRSPKPLNGPTSTPSLKSGSDSVQSSSSFGSQGKGKKRERGDQGSDSSKRERLIKPEDGDTGQFRPESMLKSEIAKITEKGALVDFEGVERLVQLMQPDSADKKIDLAGRIMLADVIAVTDRFDCLGWFVQLRGLPVLDEWLQEVHKGKIGDASMPKENDKSVEELLLALLRALDKLPVNLHALQTCNVGKSVNHLRTHKNSEIQKKARSLVDTWKKRVEAEMNISDSKSGPSRGVSWPAKPASSEASHVGSRKSGGSTEIVAKSSAMTSASKNSQAKMSSGDALSKGSPSAGSTKSMTTSVGSNLKDQNFKSLAGAGTSDLPLTPIKEERSSSSSQSQNNSLSCSSEHAKTIGSCREDARSSTAVSMSASKIPGSASRSRKSSNGLHGSALTVVQKDPHSGKNSSRNSPSEKLSPTQQAHEKSSDVSLADHGNNQRLIVKLPNTGRGPAQGSCGGSGEDPAVLSGKASSPGDKHENLDRKVKLKTDGFQTNNVSNIAVDVCNANEPVIGYEEPNGSSAGEGGRTSEDGDKVAETLKPTSLSGFVSRSGQTYDASLSSINALIESCAKFSEASPSVSPGDDAGMNLLATVAAGEISKSENVTPVVSPGRKSPVADESCSGNDDKLHHSGGAVARTLEQANGGAPVDVVNTIDSLQFKDDERHSVAPRLGEVSGDGEATPSGFVEKTGDGRNKTNSSTDLLHNAPGPCLRPETKEDTSENVSCAKKESTAEPNSSDSKLKSKTSIDEDQKVDHVDERNTENESSVSEWPGANLKIEKEGCEKSSEPSSGVGDESLISAEKVTGICVTVEKTSSLAENCESLEAKNENGFVPPSASSNPLMESKTENADDIKPCEVEHNNERQKDLDSSSLAGNSHCGEENLDRKEAFGLCSGSSVHSESAKDPVLEHEAHKKPSGLNLDRVASDGAGERHASIVSDSLTTTGSDIAVMLDFDLNEGFPVDDVSQVEVARQEEPITSSAVHVPCPLPFPIPSMSGGFHASITVASAAKGPVVPPENPLRSRGELGWKGSAATSAFRPAEPRKNTEQPLNSSDNSATKQGRAPLDFDLNVPDQRSFEDVASHGSSETCLESMPRDRGTAGLDLDLNRVDETPDSVSLSMNKLDIPSLPSKPSLSGGLSNGGNVSRDFDLNNGPGLDEVGTEAPARTQQIKSTVPFPSAVHGVRTNNVEFGNYSSWFPSASYSAINVPPLLPGRGEQSFVSSAGAQRILGPPGSTSFGPEIYRGSVLSSAPAVAYTPSTPFQYPGFPFETNFPLSSNSFSGCSTAFMDSSTAGGLCFPTMPSQLVGPGGVVSSTYPRPYVMGLPGGTSNVIPESRKWGSQSLDLNSGPGGADSERRDDRLPSGLRQLSVSSSQALVEEQMKMFQVAGGVLKRKEPDGGWDGADRYSSYKQPSWQ
ncbi:Transcription factor IIS [Senna tora]|uniref:Transcription factor IIS n=1 Tax=Senna tora TaxID=362788 RepID=A0A834WEF5_9FABA|nr:Transcription factor IIS [Senna tora]